MANIEVNASSSVCRKCGTAYGRLKGYFPVSYGFLYKGAGYLPYCKDCVDSIFTSYLTECGDTKVAVRQTCRKLDLYWNDALYETVNRQNASRSAMTAYIAKANGMKYAGKSYDDSLREEGKLWSFGGAEQVAHPVIADTTEPTVVTAEEDDTDLSSIEDDVIAYWGPGYTASMYKALEERRSYWMEHLPDGVETNAGFEALLRQIVSTELDINRDRAAGRPIDKSQAVLSQLIGNAMLKPTKKADDTDSSLEKTPFGVWIKRWEDKRPVPEPDPELKDVDGIIRYIQIWFFGHLARMLNIENAYSKLYDKEIERLRVDHPDLDDEDDDSMLFDVFHEDDGGDADGRE